ncbi:PAS domain S-box protein [Fusibacter sp. JL216-2]|uniref:PAS domain S-box protein n=1 Tax=Fusibacter sp. JL216-2 TaxID=3071453 RepID=UPI003D332923
MNKEIKAVVIQSVLHYVMPVILVALLLYISISYTLISTEFSKHEVFLGEETRIYSEIIKTQVSDVEFLSTYISRNALYEPQRLEDLDQLLYDFTNEKGGKYYQIRYIDASGQEIVKINYMDQSAQSMNDALENKKDRYYLKYDRSKENKVYLSRIDLNVENGQIEEPYKPVLRIVKPVFNDKMPVGFMVLNYNMDILLDRMNGNYRGSKSEMYITNEKGEWLIGPPETRSFGSMFPEDENSKIEHTHPSMWKKVFLNDLTTGRAEDYIYSVESIVSDSVKTFSDEEVILEEEWTIIAVSRFSTVLDPVNRFFFVILTLFLALLTFVVYTKIKFRFKQIENQADIVTLEDKLKIVTDSVYDAIVMIDSSGNIKYWNKSASLMFGYSEEEVMEKYVHDLISPKKYSDVSSAGMKKFRKTGLGPIIGGMREVDALRKDGTTFPAELMVNSVMINDEWWAVGVVRDVSNRQKRMRELKKLSRAVENSKDIIFITDKNGNILFVNNAFVEVTGFSRMEAIVSTPAILREGLEPEDKFLEIIGHLENNRSYSEITVNRRKDGSLFHYDQAVSAVYDEDGHVSNYISTGKDITDRVAAERKLKVTMEQMEAIIYDRTRSFELAKEEAESANLAKSAFLAHMSHEIRTPLNAIIGFSQLLLNESELNAKELDQVKTIFDSGEHLLSLINDILEISRIESGKVTINNAPVNFRELIEEIERIFRLKMHTKGLYFNVRFENMMDKAIITDEKKLRQILLNIVGNAVKFTSDGGIEIIVQMEAVDEDKGRIKCVVSDSADGIPEDELEKIFNPFEQVSDIKQRSKGTGLGLAITKSFIEKMGGNISVQSTVGKGSTFIIEIPVGLTELSNIDIEKNMVIKIVQFNTPLSILIVDDQSSNLKLLKDILDYEQISLFVAENGKEAVEIVNQNKIDCIFMDIRMPVMTGIEATEIIRSQGYTEIVICALTASVFEHQANDILKKGFDKLIRKPFRTNEIYQFLSENFDISVESTEKMDKDNFVQKDLFTFSSVNKETIDRLEEAMILGDIDEIKEVITEQDDLSKELKVRMIELCNDFDLISLSSIIHALQSEYDKESGQEDPS